MEALTIDEIISAKKRFLNIDKDLNLIHSVNEIKETYYLIHCIAIITFLLLKQQVLAESAAIMREMDCGWERIIQRLKEQGRLDVLRCATQLHDFNTDQATKTAKESE